MRFEKILVPTDFSENAQVALQKAYDLARQLGAKLYLLHIQDRGTLRTAIKEGLLRDDSTDAEPHASVEQLIEARFSEMMAGLDRMDVQIEHLVRLDEPKSAIVKYVEEIGADLIVVGKRGTSAMSRLGSAVLGSVAEYVIQHSACPVLVVTFHRKR